MRGPWELGESVGRHDADVLECVGSELDLQEDSNPTALDDPVFS